jgi:hypothetical protein
LRSAPAARERFVRANGFRDLRHLTQRRGNSDHRIVQLAKRTFHAHHARTLSRDNASQLAVVKLCVMTHQKTCAALSLAAASVLALMLLVGIFGSANQQHFEAVLPVPVYTRDLLAHAAPLRAILTLDACFIALYVSTSLLVARLLITDESVLLLYLSIGLVLAAALLDLLENHHIATMLSMAEQGLPISASEISAQAIASMLKWHLGYLAFFVLGLALDPRTQAEAWLRAALMFVQLPVGALYYLVPASLQPVFLWLRYLNLLTGFLAFALVLRDERPTARASAVSGSESPA